MGTHRNSSQMSKKIDEFESLKELEKEVLSHFEDEHTAKVSRFFVNLSPSNEKMWTWRIEVEDETKKSLPPIVLIHGMAGASGIFIFNIFALAQERTVFVVDLLGFGLSDRVKLGKTVAAVENKWVESIDQWRENVGIAWSESSLPIRGDLAFITKLILQRKEPREW